MTVDVIKTGDLGIPDSPADPALVHEEHGATEIEGTAAVDVPFWPRSRPDDSDQLAELPSSGPAMIELLLRRPRAFAHAIDEAEDLRPFVRAALVTVTAGGLAFGAALGSYQSGVQLLFAAIKFAALVLFSTVLVAPVISALNSALQRSSDFRRDVAALLAALARGSLVLGALAPLVLAAVIHKTPYLSVVAVMTICCFLAAAVGYQLLLYREVKKGPDGLRWMLGGLLVVGLLVSSQLGWALRPWVGPPGEVSTPFVRPIETGLVDQAFGVLTESLGYDGELIPLGRGR